MNQQNLPEKKERLSLKQMMMVSAVVIFTACCIILFYFCVSRYKGLGEGWSTLIGVFQSIFIGFGLAFLMNPIMEFFEKRMYPFFERKCKTKTKAFKTTRMICTLISLVIVVGIIALFFVAIIPELYNTIHYLAEHMTEQIDGILDWANQITKGRYEKSIMSAKGSGLNDAIDGGLKLVENYIDVGTQDLVSAVATGVINVGKLLVNILIGIIVSVYILCSKEIFKGQSKKLLYGFFRADQANTMMEIFRKTRDIFYGFIIGKIIDSIIIGVICYVCMLIFSMPYPLLVSIIVGVTNIIPVFGPYIGAVPTVILIFITEPMQGIYFMIFVIILQQIDGNIIGPKILGDSTGLSSFWVVVAIVVGGGLFGFIGMLFGVPTMALIYYLVGRFSKYMLRKRSLPEETSDYVNLERVNTEDGSIIEHTKEYHDQSHVSIGVFSKKEKKEPKKEQESQEKNE